MVASDAELVEAVEAGGAGRTAAWEALVDRHTPRLYAVARSFRLDEATAADLVQTAWLRLLERGAQLHDPSAVGPWLAMIVRNEARRLVTRRRTIPVDQGWEQRADDRLTAPEARIVAEDRRQAVRVGFARLGEDCRQLLRLLMADPPLPYTAIAAAIGRPIGAIGPTRQRCLAQLRGLLGAELEP